MLRYLLEMILFKIRDTLDNSVVMRETIALSTGTRGMSKFYLTSLKNVNMGFNLKSACNPMTRFSLILFSECERQVNGCGSGFTESVPLLFRDKFTPSCNKHDVCYDCVSLFNDHSSCFGFAVLVSQFCLNPRLITFTV